MNDHHIRLNTSSKQKKNGNRVKFQQHKKLALRPTPTFANQPLPGYKQWKQPKNDKL